MKKLLESIADFFNSAYNINLDVNQLSSLLSDPENKVNEEYQNSIFHRNAAEIINKARNYLQMNFNENKIIGLLFDEVLLTLENIDNVVNSFSVSEMQRFIDDQNFIVESDKYNTAFLITKYRKEFALLFALILKKINKRHFFREIEKLEDFSMFKSYIEYNFEYSLENLKIIDFENTKYFTSVEHEKGDNLDDENYLYDINSVPDDVVEFYRSSLSHTFEFNDVQKTVADKAVSTDENLLICAPTGCGKTIIASFTIYRLRKNFCKNFKVAYITPMKALANEITNFLSNLFRDLHIYEVTSDTHISHSEISMSNILVGTPEKIELIIRNQMVVFDLFIFDEIHILNETRGYIIEGLVARNIRTHNKRMVGLSATLYNHDDVGKFLKVEPYNIYNFGQKFRPCPIKYDIIQSDHIDLEVKDHILNEKQPIIVFVNSRKETYALADDIIQYLEKTEVANVDISDARLEMYLRYGVCIHHAGLSSATRSEIERLYREKKINIIICTSTLAWGINLPAQTVIIKGTRYFSDEIGDYTELNNINILQMFGRAGRSKDMVECKGILLSTDPMNFYYSQSIESHVLPNLCNLLLAEIYLGLSSFGETVRWFKNTFYYIRLSKYNDRFVSVAKEILFSALVVLENNGLIKNIEYPEITHLGKIAVKNFIDYKDIVKVSAEIKNMMSDGHIFDLISRFNIFEKIKCEISVNTPFPVNTDFGKIFQLYIGRISTENELIINYYGLIEKHIDRVFNAVLKICLSEHLCICEKVFEYTKAIKKRVFPYQTPLRWLIPDEKKAMEIELKNIPFEVLKKLNKEDFDNLGIEGYDTIKFLPNFNICLGIAYEDTNSIIYSLTVSKAFVDSRIINPKYLIIISDPYKYQVLYTEIVYIENGVDEVVLNFCLPKTEHVRVYISDSEIPGCYFSQIFNVSELQKQNVEVPDSFGPISVKNYDFDEIINALNVDDLLVVESKIEKENFSQCLITTATYHEFLLSPSLHKKVIIISSYHSFCFLPILWYCKHNNLNYEVYGYKLRNFGSDMLNFIGKFNNEINIQITRFYTYYDIITDLGRSLVKNINIMKSNLVIVPTSWLVSILTKLFRIDCDICTYLEVKQANFRLGSKRMDIVHIFTVTYKEYSNNQYYDYSAVDLLRLRQFGTECFLYVSERKRNLFCKNNELVVPHNLGYSAESRVWIESFMSNKKSENYVIKYNISQETINNTNDVLKNGMGVLKILSIVTQNDETFIEMLDDYYCKFPQYKKGLTYLIASSLIDGKKDLIKPEDFRYFSKGVLSTLIDMLYITIDLSLSKKYFKTVFNTIFLSQKLKHKFVESQDKFFALTKNGKNIEISLKVLPKIKYFAEVKFFIIEETMKLRVITFTCLESKNVPIESGSCYVLCDCYEGYEIIEFS